MAPWDALRVLHRAIDQGSFDAFLYDLCAHREVTESHATADSRRTTVQKATRVLMKSLHSDKASGLISTLWASLCQLRADGSSSHAGT
eukprot:8153678-Alexandrium_andersonii.AAC.1